MVIIMRHKKKCENPECRQWFIPEKDFQHGCCPECQYQVALIKLAEKRKKDQQAAAAKKREQLQRDKEERKALRERKIALRTRNDWFDILQEEVNRHVLLRDRDKGCCTCGTRNQIKYDAGHYLSRGARPELRFELTNIHKQCSVNCNQHGSGMRAEYQEFIREKYGEAHLDWLKGPHPSLKEQFPTIESIKKEISRYRQLNKTLKKEIEEKQLFTECY